MKLKRAVIKEELVALTQDTTQAILLNQLIYWSERVGDFDKFIDEERKRMESNGEKLNIRKQNGWIYKTAEELSDETMLGLSPQSIRRYLKKLIDNGWIEERQNPEYKWDRTTQYRVNIGKIQEDLYELGYALDDYPLVIPKTISDRSEKNGGCNLQNGKSNVQNGHLKIQNGDLNLQSGISYLQVGEAIPEITTETTSEITTETTSETTSQHNIIIHHTDTINQNKVRCNNIYGQQRVVSSEPLSSEPTVDSETSFRQGNILNQNHAVRNAVWDNDQSMDQGTSFRQGNILEQNPVTRNTVLTNNQSIDQETSFRQGNILNQNHAVRNTVWDNDQSMDQETLFMQGNTTDSTLYINHKLNNIDNTIEQRPGQKELETATENKTAKPSKKRKNKYDYSEEFEEFWALYPRRVDKEGAYRKFMARVKDGITPSQLCAAAKNYAEYCRLRGSDPQYIKHAKTFLGTSAKGPFSEFINGMPEDVRFANMSKNTRDALLALQKIQMAEEMYAGTDGYDWGDGSHDFEGDGTTARDSYSVVSDFRIE